MAESTTKQAGEDKKSKKNRSPSEDEDENQVEKPLLESTPKTEVKQPKKKKMPLFKKKPAAEEAAAGGGDSSMFDITLEQLNDIMEVRGKDLIEKLDSSDYNGVKGILEKLKVDGKKGLDSNNEQDLEQRRTAYGRNEIPPKPMKTFLKLCWDAFHDMLLVILLVCAVVSIGLSFYKPPHEEGETKEEEPNLEWIEGVAILVAVLVVVFVTAFNDWRKERQFRGLQDKIDKDQQTSVIRDNSVQQIPISELVVGDLCFIKYGDLLPADGLIVQSSDLKIDESSITGETDLVKKSKKEDVGLLSGTNVMEGSGRMIVVGVGLNSQVGRIMSLLGATDDDSKKGKKGKKKDKKKDSKNEKKKEKKSKPKITTKVSPDTSKPDENEDNTQTIHTENEKKPHPRTRKLPPLQQSNNDEQEMKPIKDEKKTSKDSQNKNQQQKKESSSSSSSDDEQKKKKSSNETEKKSDKTEEQKQKSTKPKQEEKKSSSSESSDEEPEKKSDNTEKQKKKSTKPRPTVELEKKKSSSSDEETEKKSDKTEEQKQKSTKPKQQEKKSSSSESSDEESEKKSDKTEEQKKKSTKPELEKKKSSSSENSNNQPDKKSDDIEEPTLKSTKTQTDIQQEKKKRSDEEPEKKSNKDELQKKKSSSSESSNNQPEKKSSNTDNQDAEQKKKKLTKAKTTNEQEEKKSSTSESSDEDQKKKSTSNENKDDKKLTKTKSKDIQSEKKSNKNESSDEEQEKKSEVNKQKQGTSSDVDKKSSKKKEEDGDGKDSKEDPEKKPAGLAALAEEGADEEGGGDGGSKSGKQKSVLQTKLTRLALYIGYIGMTAAFLTLICLIVRFCITRYVIKKKEAKASDVSFFISFLIQAITVVVVSVPEGLPLAVTLALAYAVRKMMTDNNLVRHLDACETMGNASTICSDKTGTLTTNRMTVVQCYITGKHYDKLPKGEEVNKDLSPLLFEAVTVNANYTTKIEEAKKEEGGLPKQVGNKTECALLGLVQQWGGSYDEIRQEIPEDKLVKVFTFNSARKMMSTIIERDEGYRVYTKGASEMVLAKCKSIIGKDNKPKDLNDDEKKKITHDVIEKMANDGLRTICIAYRDIGKDKQNWDDDGKIVKDLICIAIVGIEDPVRDEVPEAIEKCQKAGVVVRMVTGDNIMTARSIATKCGIIKPEDDFLVLEGKEFNKKIRDSSGKISQKKLDEVWPKLRVLARSSPTDKYNLVNGIVESQATQHREVVAVTGDGTNDGPALKRADVGFAMGIQGTDVAKQASDIILTDDNFSSIVKAMMWGRNVYDCIAKFLQFQLTANLSAGVLSVISAAAISAVPLRAVQMLWVNLVMDTLASLALATEPPTEALLKRKPYGRTKSIISPLMMRNILGQSMYQLIIMFIILYAGQYFLGVDSTVDEIQKDQNAGREASQQFTLVFNAFVLMTLFNEINSRKLHGERNVFAGIFQNPFFYCIWIGCFVAQILIVTFGDKVFSCARLDIKQWAWSLLFGVGSLIWQQILLFIPIKPFASCFSTLYRVCCPCIYKKQKKKEEKEEGGERGKSDDKTKKEKRKEKEGDERRKSDDKIEKKRPSKKIKDEDDIDVEEGSDIFPKYSTIIQLTNATVVAQPPPIFARYMLRKSVDRLNSEFRVINEFRSRLERVKDKRYSETLENKRNSQDNDLDE